jgi:hypothetical protein
MLLSVLPPVLALWMGLEYPPRLLVLLLWASLQSLVLVSIVPAKYSGHYAFSLAFFKKSLVICLLLFDNTVCLFPSIHNFAWIVCKQPLLFHCRSNCRGQVRPDSCKFESGNQIALPAFVLDVGRAHT